MCISLLFSSRKSTSLQHLLPCFSFLSSLPLNFHDKHTHSPSAFTRQHVIMPSSIIFFNKKSQHSLHQNYHDSLIISTHHFSSFFIQIMTIINKLHAHTPALTTAQKTDQSLGLLAANSHRLRTKYSFMDDDP